jgi:hypothetical protein
MSPSRPFFDPVTGALDTDQLIYEAVPLAKLAAAVLVVAAVPFLFGLGGPLGLVFVFLTQFVLLVGGGLFLLYVVARGRQL